MPIVMISVAPFSILAVIIMADEEEDPVCPYPQITEACKPQCSAPFASYEVSVWFYALETIARVPYFSYTSVLHLYETIGHFRDKEYIKLHFDQAWNELQGLVL